MQQCRLGLYHMKMTTCVATYITKLLTYTGCMGAIGVDIGPKMCMETTVLPQENL